MGGGRDADRLLGDSQTVTERNGVGVLFARERARAVGDGLFTMNTSGSGYMPQPLRRTTDEPVSLLVEVFVYDLSAPTQVFDEPVSTMRESII